MRAPRITNPEAATRDAVARLLRKFEYPETEQLGVAVTGGGGGGMAHYLIVSDSEPSDVQDKADFVITQTNSAAPLQSVFDSLPGGPISIWMAGKFELDDDVTAPSSAWIRGLGYQSVGGST